MYVKCDSWHTRYDNLGRKVEECWGTKECERCHCGGDKAFCDFYPDIRAKEMLYAQDRYGWFDGTIDRKKLLEKLVSAPRPCPAWILEIIGHMDFVKKKDN